MVLEKKYPNFEEGYYGTVFFTPDGRATKVFKRQNDDFHSHTKDVFESEVKAYEIAMSNNTIVNFVPKYYGCVPVSKIVDPQGNDISHQYELTFSYQMQKVEGHFEKNSCSLTEVGKLFRDAGIHHLSDTSVIFDDRSNITCLIDFAVQNYELTHLNF